MRIAVVTPLFPSSADPYRGQPIAETVRALRRYADVHVVCANAVYVDGRTAPQHKRDSPGVIDVSYPAVPFFSRPWNGIMCASRIYEPLARLRPDLILNYWLYPEGYAAIRCARALGVPVIVGARGSDLRRIRDPFTRRMVVATLREADSILLVSSELREQVRRLGVPTDKTTVILNGCDHEIFHYGGSATEAAECGVRSGERVILFVGRLTKPKGIAELMGAFAIVARQHPDVRLVFAGNGSMSRHIASFTERNGLRGRVEIRGALSSPDVARLMRSASLLCLPSYSEGCPNVVIEAVSCGCPVVVTGVGGTPELVGPDCSVTVEPRNIQSLAEGLQAALGRTWDRPAISASFQRTWDDVARETYQVCRDKAAPERAPAVVPARRRLKVAVVSSYFPQKNNAYRGHSAYHTLIRMQEEADIEVVCPLASYPGRAEVPAERQYGSIPVQYVGYPAFPMVSRPVNGFTCVNLLLPRIRAIRPDVILNYWLYPDGFSAMQVGRTLGVPVVVGSIGSDLRRISDPFTRYFVGRTLREASGVITVSEELRRRAIGFGLPPEKVTAILNGFDAATFFPGDRATARREVGYAHDGELILFVGTLLKTKGLHELVVAFQGLAARRPNVRLAIIGEGIFSKVLRRLVAESGLGDRILMLGRKPSSEVGAWMRAADVFCLPSYSEGCPNVVVEALACGVPVVATDVGGTPELVRDSSAGILVPPQNADAIRRALSDALSRTWDRDLIARAYSRNWAEAARETLAVCRRVVDPARAENSLLRAGLSAAE